VYARHLKLNGPLKPVFTTRFVLGSVWLKSQIERNRSVPVLLLFGYKVIRTEWLQLGNILLRSGTIPLQKINGTESLRSNSALTVTLRSVHSATKQKTEPFRSRLPNTEQSGSVPRIRDGTAPFYLALQPNTTLAFFLTSELFLVFAHHKLLRTAKYSVFQTDRQTSSF
jgi:hypothetical protein